MAPKTKSRSVFASRASVVAGLLSLLALAACGGEPECANIPAECAPLYTPTYEALFNMTLKPTCGQPGTSCHATEGAQAGVVFSDADAAHQMLIDRALVVPNDAACSPLVGLIEGTDPARMMPPGMQLIDAERCVVHEWIRGGAAR